MRETRQAARWLAAADDDTFNGFVADDAHGRVAPDLAAGLRDPVNRFRWHRALRVILANINAQLAERKGQDDLETATWRGRVIRWQSVVLERKAEASRLIRESRIAQSRDVSLQAKRDRGEAGNAAVHRLIEAHRDEFDRLLAEELLRAGLELSEKLVRSLSTARRLTWDEARERLEMIRDLKAQ